MSTVRGPDPRPARSRELLVQAVTQLLAEGGIEAATIDAVTRTSGVSRATLYRHFDGGAELVAAGLAELLPPAPAAPGAGSLRDRLLSLLTATAAIIDEVPLQVTVLAWLTMNPQEPPPDRSPAEISHIQLLRERVLDQYRLPFQELLGDPAAAAELGGSAAGDRALAQLLGPLVFNRLVTMAPNDAAFCAQVVDDFLTARGEHVR